METVGKLSRGPCYILRPKPDSQNLSRFPSFASSRMNLWTLDADVDAEEDDEDQQVPLIGVSVLFSRVLT